MVVKRRPSLQVQNDVFYFFFFKVDLGSANLEDLKADPGGGGEGEGSDAIVMVSCKVINTIFLMQRS